MTETTWTAAEDGYLKANWGTVSASELGQQMGRAGMTARGKNQVLGRARRLGLTTAKPSGKGERGKRVDAIVKAGWERGLLPRDIATDIYAEIGCEYEAVSVTRIAHEIGLEKRFGGRPTHTPDSVRRPGRAPACESVTLAPGAVLVPVLERRGDQCAFVVEERPSIMCGAPVSGPRSDWCAYHRSLVYVRGAAKTKALREIDAAAARDCTGGADVLAVAL